MWSSEHHLPTGPKSSVAYVIKSDHKQNTNKTERVGVVKIKKLGGKTVNNTCSITPLLCELCSAG